MQQTVQVQLMAMMLYSQQLTVAPATLSTTDVSLVTATTAHSGGIITSAGGGNISSKGSMLVNIPKPDH